MSGRDEGEALDEGLRVEAYYRSIDAQDVIAALTIFDEHCTYRRPGYAPLVGKAAITAFYEADRIIVSGTHEVETLIVEGPMVAAAGTFFGLLRDGQQVEVGFADLFRFEGAHVVERTTYFHKPAV